MSLAAILRGEDGPLTHRWLWVNGAILAVSVVLSLAVLAILAIGVGASPIAAIGALLEGALGSRQALASTAREAVPIALAALAFLIPLRAGFFNIGGQGQLELAALAGLLVALHLGAPAIITIPVAMLVAALVGAIAVTPALALKVKRGASEVTTTIMLNFAITEFVLAMVTGPLKDPGAFFSTTRQVPEALRLPGGDMHIGIWLALGVIVALYWVLRRTVFGFELEAVGGNRGAAAAAGIRVDRVLVIAVLLAAAIAGLAGGIQAMGVVHRVAEGWSKPWGFVGILAALLGGNAIGVLPAALFLAVLETGGRHMQAMTSVPAALVYLLQSLPVIAYLALKASPVARRLSLQPTQA
jgi:simple sugar transport system permease protein